MSGEVTLGEVLREIETRLADLRLPAGYARYDGQSPDVQRIPQPVQRYVYRIDVGSYSAAATRFTRSRSRVNT